MVNFTKYTSFSKANLKLDKSGNSARYKSQKVCTYHISNLINKTWIALARTFTKKNCNILFCLLDKIIMITCFFLLRLNVKVNNLPVIRSPIRCRFQRLKLTFLTELIIYLWETLTFIRMYKYSISTPCIKRERKRKKKIILRFSFLNRHQDFHRINFFIFLHAINGNGKKSFS